MSPLPSLKAMQAFEVAARTGSFLSAAQELRVSPAAVSQLVRTLEAQTGRRLFRRVNRGILLTEAGLEILPRLRVAFEELHGVARQLLGVAPRPRITVSVPTSVATGWLSSRLASFIQAEGPTEIFLRGEDDPPATDQETANILMSYGHVHDRRHETEEIITDVVLPVCSPAFLASNPSVTSAADILSMPLIHTDWGRAAATFPSWRLWFEMAGVGAGQQVERGMRTNFSGSALALAVDGLGVALSQGIYAAGPIADGRLVCAFPSKLPLAQPYCLTVPKRSEGRPLVVKFKDWLSAEIKSCVESSLRALMR